MSRHRFVHDLSPEDIGGHFGSGSSVSIRPVGASSCITIDLHKLAIVGNDSLSINFAGELTNTEMEIKGVFLFDGHLLDAHEEKNDGWFSVQKDALAEGALQEEYEKISQQQE